LPTAAAAAPPKFDFFSGRPYQPLASAPPTHILPLKISLNLFRIVPTAPPPSLGDPKFQKAGPLPDPPYGFCLPASPLVPRSLNLNTSSSLLPCGPQDAPDIYRRLKVAPPFFFEARTTSTFFWPRKNLYLTRPPPLRPSEDFFPPGSTACRPLQHRATSGSCSSPNLVFLIAQASTGARHRKKLQHRPPPEIRGGLTPARSPIPGKNCPNPAEEKPPHPSKLKNSLPLKAKGR